MVEGPLGVISDIHANRVALDAVVADGVASGVERWLVLGDVVAMGPEPAAVLEVLEGLDVVAAVSGNTERYVLTGDTVYPTPDDVRADPTLLARLIEVVTSFAWTRGYLASAGRLADVERYTADYRLTLADGQALLAVHASAAADDGQGITPDVDADALSALFAGVEATVVLAGHTHQPTDRVVAGRRYVNPGSVSNSPGPDKAARYALLRQQPAGLDIELRRVDYDVDLVRHQIRTCGIPGAGFLLRRYFN